MAPTDPKVDPSLYLLGSPESRAAARLLAQSRMPLERVVRYDGDGNAIWDPQKTYGPVIRPVCTDMSREEWIWRYAAYPDDERTPEQREEHRRRDAENSDANLKAWRKKIWELLKEFNGAVPGAVAAKRIPPGPTLAALLQKKSSDEETGSAGTP